MGFLPQHPIMPARPNVGAGELLEPPDQSLCIGGDEAQGLYQSGDHIGLAARHELTNRRHPRFRVPREGLPDEAVEVFSGVDHRRGVLRGGGATEAGE